MVPEGQYTSMVYTAIKDARFPEAVHLLTSELGVRIRGRSLFGCFCSCISGISLGSNKLLLSAVRLVSSVRLSCILLLADATTTSKHPRL